VGDFFSGDVTHGGCGGGGLQEKPPVALLDNDGRAVDALQAELAAKRGRRGEAAAFADRESKRHAVMLDSGKTGNKRENQA
jgi:hypothetical protein